MKNKLVSLAFLMSGLIAFSAHAQTAVPQTPMGSPPGASPVTTPATPPATAPVAAPTPAPGGGPGMVWVNPKSHVYRCYGSKHYGTTKVGSYMTESDAKAAGAHGAHGKTCGG